MNDPLLLTMEDRLSDVLAKFHHEQQGHSPTCASTILPSMAIVMSTNVFTNTEAELVQTDEGRKIVQSARREQRALTRRDAEKRVGQVLSRSIRQSFYDIDVRSGDQVEVYILD